MSNLIRADTAAIFIVITRHIIHLPRLICLVLRLWRQHPIISMLINTNDVPDAMPKISNVPEIACVGVVLVVGGPPSDDAGWPVGGASTFQFPDGTVNTMRWSSFILCHEIMSLIFFIVYVVVNFHIVETFVEFDLYFPGFFCRTYVVMRFFYLTVCELEGGVSSSL